MQRAKLFEAQFAYVNNIQITWKTTHLSVFCRTNSSIYSSNQSRRKLKKNTKCVGKKRFNGSVTHGFRKENVFSPPFWTRQGHIVSFPVVICNSLLLLKSLPINVINCIKFYVNCSALTGAYDWQYKYLFVCLYANHLP
jgi:hypothetical protein